MTLLEQLEAEEQRRSPEPMQIEINGTRINLMIIEKETFIPIENQINEEEQEDASEEER